MKRGYDDETGDGTEAKHRHLWGICTIKDYKSTFGKHATGKELNNIADTSHVLTPADIAIGLLTGVKSARAPNVSNWFVLLAIVARAATLVRPLVIHPQFSLDSYCKQI